MGGMLRKVSDDLQRSSGDFSMTSAGCSDRGLAGCAVRVATDTYHPARRAGFVSTNAQAGQRLDYHANGRRCAARVHFRFHRRTERVVTV